MTAISNIFETIIQTTQFSKKNKNLDLEKNH